jgi:hypothetical protein
MRLWSAMIDLRNMGATPPVTKDYCRRLDVVMSNSARGQIEKVVENTVR